MPVKKTTTKPKSKTASKKIAAPVISAPELKMLKALQDSKCNSKQMSALSTQMKTVGPGTLLAALGILSDIGKLAKTPEGKQLIADCQKSFQEASLMSQTEDGQDLIRKITKLLASLGIELPEQNE